MSELDDFLIERDAMLCSADVDRALAFWAKWAPEFKPSSRYVAEIAMHKARTACKSLPLDVRRCSKYWLCERGYQAHDDDDL